MGPRPNKPLAEPGTTMPGKDDKRSDASVASLKARPKTDWSHDAAKVAKQTAQGKSDSKKKRDALARIAALQAQNIPVFNQSQLLKYEKPEQYERNKVSSRLRARNRAAKAKENGFTGVTHQKQVLEPEKAQERLERRRDQNTETLEYKLQQIRIMEDYLICKYNGACAKCHEKFLSRGHIELNHCRGIKLFDPRASAATQAWKALVREMAKLEPLCRICHLLTTYHQIANGEVNPGKGKAFGHSMDGKDADSANNASTEGLQHSPNKEDDKGNPKLGMFARLPSELVLYIMEKVLIMRALGQGCGCHDCDEVVPRNHKSLLEFVLASRVFYEMGLAVLLKSVSFDCNSWEGEDDDAWDLRKKLQQFAEDYHQKGKFALVRSLSIPSSHDNDPAIAVLKLCVPFIERLVVFGELPENDSSDILVGLLEMSHSATAIRYLRWGADFDSSRVPNGCILPTRLEKLELFPESAANISLFAKLATNNPSANLIEWTLGLPAHANAFEVMIKEQLPESFLSKLKIVTLNVGDFVWFSHNDTMKTRIAELSLQTHCGYDTRDTEQAWSLLREYQKLDKLTTYDTEFSLAFLLGLPAGLRVLTIKGYEFELEEPEWITAREILANIPIVNVASWSGLTEEEEAFWGSCEDVDLRDLSWDRDDD